MTFDEFKMRLFIMGWSVDPNMTDNEGDRIGRKWAGFLRGKEYIDCPVVIVEETDYDRILYGVSNLNGNEDFNEPTYEKFLAEMVKRDAATSGGLS